MYRSSVYSGNHTETKWAPFSGYGMTGLACWRNISYTFKYELREGSLYDPYFTNISENYITSYISGLNAVSWNQTGKSANIANNGKSVMLKVSGYYLLGVEVAGFTIGAKIPDNWKMTSHIDDAL